MVIGKLKTWSLFGIVFELCGAMFGAIVSIPNNPNTPNMIPNNSKHGAFGFVFGCPNNPNIDFQA